MPQHRQRHNAQKATTREQIQTHIDRNGCHDSEWKGKLSAMKQMRHDTAEERISRRKHPLLSHQIGKSQLFSLEQRMMPFRHRTKRRLEQYCRNKIVRDERWHPASHQYIESSFTQLSFQRVRVRYHDVITYARILPR